MISYLLIHCRWYNGRKYPLAVADPWCTTLRERQVQLFLAVERARPLSLSLSSYTLNSFWRLSMLTIDRNTLFIGRLFNRCYVGRPHVVSNAGVGNPCV